MLSASLYDGIAALVLGFGSAYRDTLMLWLTTSLTLEGTLMLAVGVWVCLPRLLPLWLS